MFDKLKALFRPEPDYWDNPKTLPIGAYDVLPAPDTTVGELIKLTQWGRALKRDGSLTPWEKIWYHTRLRPALKKETPFVRSPNV